MRCPACGARNSEDAAWCTQCYADVRADRDELAPPGPGAAPDEAFAGRPEPARVGDADPVRDVRERDGEVEWRCRACDGWSPLTAPTCAICGTARRGFGDMASTGPRHDLSEAGIVMASVLLPGLGHVLAGRSGTGLARAILAVLWLLGGLALVVGSPGLGGLPGWVLLVSAAVLWVVTIVDARSLVAGTGQELLTPRRLGALVIAVTLGLIAAAGVVLVGAA